MSFRDQPPMLGLATTGFLIEELEARYEMHGPDGDQEEMKTLLNFLRSRFACCLHGGLAYRTVDKV